MVRTGCEVDSYSIVEIRLVLRLSLGEGLGEVLVGIYLYGLLAP